MALEDALDLCWQTMAACFGPEELFVKQSLIDRYFPKQAANPAQPPAGAAEPARAAAGAEDGDGANAAQ
jgi:V/A-type H+-transporting ATPase subunit B